MGKNFWDDEFCQNSLQYYPIGDYIPGIPNNIGILSVVSGILNVFMSIMTVIWIKSQEREAQAENGREEAVKSVIFPVFVKVLWASAIVNVYTGIVTAFVPLNPVGDNSLLISATYALVWALQHAVLEGIAFLLMQKGCGQHAASAAGKMAFAWAAVTFVLMFLCFRTGGHQQDYLEIGWDLIMIVFYCALWLAPQKSLFRRPAAILYARFWFCYRTVVVCTNILLFFKSTTNLGSCGYIFATVVLFAVFEPLICYWTLLQDSRWWQGLDIDQGTRRESNEDIRSPLVGSDFSLFSAQSLANTMDNMRVHGQVKMLNFACIKLDHSKHLGAGSFSKVYKGTYRGKECAIKLIYTLDLTADVIKRVAAEASILSSIRHPNIVNIFGVSVLPPSVCLILELCSFGSLSDLIRGYGFDWNTSHRAPLNLSRTDMLYLALGCAKGLAAVHAYDTTICHRDVKSFNFLVDCQFNVKIADLELGINTTEERSRRPPRVSEGDVDGQYDEEEGIIGSNRDDDPEQVAVEELLANWMAPEVLRNRKFQQASDIYSLGSVMWEIITGLLPYDNDSQSEIRQKILEGYRHPMPIQFRGTPIANLITRCWNEDPKSRPLGEQVVTELEGLLSDQCYCLIGDVEGAPNTTTLRDFYEQHFRQSNASSVLGDSSVHRGRHAKMSFTSIFNRFHPSGGPVSEFDPNYKLSFDRRSSGDQQVDSDRSSRSSRSSNASLTKPLVSGGELESLVRNDESVAAVTRTPPRRQQRESKSYFSNNMYSLRMQAQMPRSALDAIGIVKEESYWRQLEGHGGAWAVVTVEPPHLVMHATSAWYRMFDINPSTISYTRLESLVSLMGTYTTAYVASSGSAAAYTSSNSYANFANMEDQEQCVSEILQKLEGYQQVHGVSCFHLPACPESGRNLGHNMMCTLHAYPVYSPKAWAQLEAAAAFESPSKKSFSFRQTLTNLTSRASFATSMRNSVPDSFPASEDHLTSSYASQNSEEASFSPTDYMGSSLLDTLGDDKSNKSASFNHSFNAAGNSASKPRLMGDFSFRSQLSRSVKPNESIPPLYFAVLFNEMSEQLPPSSTASKGPSPGADSHNSGRSRNSSFDTKGSNHTGGSGSSNSGISGNSGSRGVPNTFNPLQKFRSLITPPRTKEQGASTGKNRATATSSDDFAQSSRSYSNAL